MRGSRTPIMAIIGALTLAGVTVAIQQVSHQGLKARVPTDQVVDPAGESVLLRRRVLDIVPIPGRAGVVAVKDNAGLTLVDTAKMQALAHLAAQGGMSMHGIAISPDGSTAFLSNAGSRLLVADLTQSPPVWKAPIELPKPKIGGETYPCGLAWTPAGTLLVCASRSNALLEVSPADGKVLRSVDVDIAPYDVAVSRNGSEAVVSCWSPKASEGDETAPSSGTPVPVTEGGRARHGSVVQVNLADATVSHRYRVGLQPTQIQVDAMNRAFVACANSDTVAVLDLEAKQVRTTLLTRPDPALALGSAPNALALSPSGDTLYVALGDLNAVGVYGIDGEQLTLKGMIPTGWYPGAVLPWNDGLLVGSVKGIGSRQDPMAATGRGVYQFTGLVTMVPKVSEEGMKLWTRRVLTDARVRLAKTASEAKPRPGRAPVPVPERTGEPSVFQHVIYILKENRTYDQLFGDMKKGDGDPRFCNFPRAITPNHHALADQFVLLDNYYCNGVLSADGHAWSMEGNATTYFERSFGGWTRSYPFGDDPLAVSESGYLWDGILKAGKTFLNFGEFDYAEPVPANATFKQIWDDYKSKSGKIKFTHNIGVAKLRRFSVTDCPGWNMRIPDQMRADVFLRELAKMEKAGRMPNLTILYYPQDHASGTSPGMPTPEAHMADNDLAVGRVIEAISRSKFWRNTVIFVNEDDPQAGFDHVDGHRSICLVVSPYTKRGQVVSKMYNQTSVLHTIQRILGVKPMTHHEARSNLMTDCFTSKPDFSPYKSLPVTVPLDKLNPAAAGLSGLQRELAIASQKIDFSRPDRADEDLLNRILWHATMGYDKRYPAEYAGAHGRGLRAKGLKLDPNPTEDD
jgi:DNA-binding beta-propeller fold protein YncE